MAVSNQIIPSPASAEETHQLRKELSHMRKTLRVFQKTIDALKKMVMQDYKSLHKLHSNQLKTANELRVSIQKQDSLAQQVGDIENGIDRTRQDNAAAIEELDEKINFVGKLVIVLAAATILTATLSFVGFYSLARR